MKKTYYGFFGTKNCETYNRDPYKFTCLKDARKTMRAIAYGNNTGSGAWWRVQDGLDETSSYYPVAQGTII